MDLIPIAKAALWNAYRVHQDLGDAGLEPMPSNQFGEVAVRGDIEAEKAVIETFRKHAVPIRFISEEHGTTDLVQEPRFLGVLDGLDGSTVYKRARGTGQYGTMLAILANTDPTYNEYLFNGIMEHCGARLFWARKGGGAFVTAGNTDMALRNSGRMRLDKNARLMIDEYWDFNKNTFTERLVDFRTENLVSTAAHHMQVLEGKADAVLECTRKGNLELAVAYGLHSESTGCMVDFEGSDIGSQRYHVFGQEKHIPIISAASPELAEDIIRAVKK